MSIFETKEWWGLRVSEKEEFDTNHLCIAPLNTNQPDQQLIILGSFTGFLRVFSPKKRKYKIEDLLLEQNFEMPIIQLAAGQFNPTSQELALCVLFFKKISVFCFNVTPGEGLQAKLIYETKLPRNAYNMTWGKFGGVKNRDFICVQSCDGALMVFEQDKFSCICQINDFVLPSPIEYLSNYDSLILQNSSYDIESYRYNTLSSNFQSFTDLKKINPDWSLNLGEQAHKIMKKQGNSADFLVLTETMMFVVDGKGRIKGQKKFEYLPSTFCIYEGGDKKPDQDPATGEYIYPVYLLVGSFTGHILVYRDFELIWATKTDHISHGIRVSNFENQKGLIVTLNDEGWLEVSYLATDPPLLQQGIIDTKEINYEKLDQDFSNLFEEISKRELNPESTAKTKTETLKIHASTSPPYSLREYVEDSARYYKDENGGIISCKLKITVSFNGLKANNITIYLNLPDNLYADQNPIKIESLSGNSTPYNTSINLFCLNNFYPYKTNIEIQTDYFNFVPGVAPHKDPRTVYETVPIPTGLQARIVPPVKQANFKITIAINRELPPFTKIFWDAIEAQENAGKLAENPNVLSFCLGNGKDSSILIAKSSSRAKNFEPHEIFKIFSNEDKFRIQSSQFEGLAFILFELTNRLYQIFKEKGFEISFADSLPLQDLFITIDDHFAIRQSIINLKESLEQKASQFRIIQKRLLTRFKERNPNPLNNLDLLFNSCYEEIIEVGGKVEEFQESYRICSHQLKISLLMIIYLLKIRFNMSDKTAELIQNCFLSENLRNENEIGWEEITYANITYILKAVIRKEQNIQNTLHPLDDISKFKKHITILIDKISKESGVLPLEEDAGEKEKPAKKKRN